MLFVKLIEINAAFKHDLPDHRKSPDHIKSFHHNPDDILVMVK
jgi:hypothetical protein